jgi:hypothetical protein
MPFLAADERRQRPRATPSAAAACANDAEELDRLGHALEFARALLLGHEEPGDLALDVQGDKQSSWFGGCLHPRCDVRRVAEHFTRRVDHHWAQLDADACGKLGGALAAVLVVDLRERTLDCQPRPDRPLGVVLLRLGIAEEGHQAIAEPL